MLRPYAWKYVKASSGYKTRRVDDIFREVQGFFDAHDEVGTYPGGVHFEMTGKNVTECVGGIIEVTEEKLETVSYTL